MPIVAIEKAIRANRNESKAKHLMRFFKTGVGEYGYGDKFLGLTVPQQRVIAKQFSDLSLDDCKHLLQSPYHEERLISLMILVNQFKRTSNSTQQRIYTLYLSQTKRINNWDLVDASAHHIVGAFLADKNIKPLRELAVSDLLWDRRIAMVACWHTIRLGQHEPAFTIAAMLLNDQEDLMHKAVGWMLREVGKHVGRDELKSFLVKHYSRLPRTALRYAIEHFPPDKRKQALVGKF